MSALDVLLPLPVRSAEWPAPLPDHLSPSSLKMYMRCREQWRRRYLLGQKERPGAALVWGTAHNFALVETNFAQKITTGEDLPVADVELAFAEGFDQRVERDGGEGEIAWDQKPGVMKDKGVALAAAYHTQVSASVQPVTVEESFSLELPGVPVPVIGYMDVTEPGRTIDLKTGSKREMKPDNAFQGRVYQLARPVPMEFHLATKTKVPGIYTPAEWPEFGLEFSESVQARTRLMLVTLAQDIAATFARFGPDDPWPGAFTYGWSCGFCGWGPKGNGTCAWWAGESTSVPVQSASRAGFQIPAGARAEAQARVAT